MINLKERFGQKYRIGYDQAVASYPELKSDPDYQIILCRFGEIYAFSSDLLAVWVRGGKRIAKMISQIPELKFHNNGEGEAIFQFKPELLDRVGQFVGIRKRRQLSPEAKAKLLSMSQQFGFKAKTRQPVALQEATNDELF
jgi:hypothetical protein